MRSYRVVLLGQWRHDILITPAYQLQRASKVAQVVKNLLANAGHIRDMGLISGSGRSPGGGHGNPFQYSCLENSMDRGGRWTMVHRVARKWPHLLIHSTDSLTHPSTHYQSLVHTLLGSYYYLRGKKLGQGEGKNSSRVTHLWQQLWDSHLGRQSFMLKCKVYYLS